jgi:hypothetical protein
MMNARASQAAAEYIAAIEPMFAPVVVQEFKDRLFALIEQPGDQSQAVFDLIENHDVANETRTMEAYFAPARAALGNRPFWDTEAVPGAPLDPLP